MGKRQRKKLTGDEMAYALAVGACIDLVESAWQHSDVLSEVTRAELGRLMQVIPHARFPERWAESIPPAMRALYTLRDGGAVRAETTEPIRDLQREFAYLGATTKAYGRRGFA